MRLRLAITLIPALALAPVSLGAQNRFDAVKITVLPVAKGVFMLQGAGGNMGLSVGEDDAFLVDDQYTPLTARIKAAIATVTPRPVRFVVNTHWHDDHTGGNENLAAGGTIIVAHENVRRRMGTEQVLEAVKRTVPASPRGALPAVTFTDTISFFANGDSMRVIHVKHAHTDGDALVHFRGANVIHMGDVYFNGSYPFIDAASGGTIDGTIAAVKTGIAMGDADTKYIPGHGPLASRADLQAYHDVLVTVRSRIARLIAQRRTLAQIVAARPLADYDDTWGKGFMKPEQFVTIVHGTLVRAPRTTKR